MIVLLVVVATCIAGAGGPDSPEDAVAESTKEAAEAAEKATERAEKASEEATKTAEEVEKEATKQAEEAAKEATKTAEKAAEEAEKVLDKKRKSVDDLPNCKDARDIVYTVEWKNRGNSRRYLSKIENYSTLDVEITERTATITCAGEAWHKDGTYIGWVKYWVRKNARDQKGTHYAGYSIGRPQSIANPTPTHEPTPDRQGVVLAAESTEEATPAATAEPTPKTGKCPTSKEQEYFQQITKWRIPMGVLITNIVRFTEYVDENPLEIRRPSWHSQVDRELSSFLALARNISEAEPPESAQHIQVEAEQYAEVIRAFVDAYSRGADAQDADALDQALEWFDESLRQVTVESSINSFCS